FLPLFLLFVLNFTSTLTCVCFFDFPPPLFDLRPDLRPDLRLADLREPMRELRDLPAFDLLLREPLLREPLREPRPLRLELTLPLLPPPVFFLELLSEQQQQ